MLDNTQLQTTCDALVANDSQDYFAPAPHFNEYLLTEVMRDYSPGLRIYVSRNVRIYEDVDDLLQELYIRIMNCSNPEKIKSVKAYVYTIAANLLRDRSRRSYTKLHDLSVCIDNVEPPVDEVDPERILEGCEELSQITDVIALLQPDCKKAFVQSRFEGMSYKEIAFGLGVSISMVEKHIANGVAKFDAFMVGAATTEQNAIAGLESASHISKDGINKELL